MPADNEEPILAKDGPSTHQPLQKLKPVHWWFLVILNILFLIVGQAAAVLLGRFYYDKGGNSTWMATLVQTAGFPILLIPCFFLRSPNESQNLSTPPSILTISVIYIIVGVLIAGDNMLYSIGLLYLSASTYSLICATQLAFNAIFSYFINNQKFTSLILNSVVILSLSAFLLAINDDSDKPSGVSNKHYMIGIVTSLVASALYSLLLSLMQLTFEKVLKKETFSVVLEMQIFTAIVATCVTIIGLFASGEWQTLRGEMDIFATGRVSYVMTLVWTAVAWQVCSVGIVGLIFVVSSLFSNVISTLSLAVTPIAALIFFHDAMNGVKIIAMLLALWGFTSYIYQNYLDDQKNRRRNEGNDVRQGGNYGVLRNPRAPAPLQYVGPILSGLGLQRNNSDSDRWHRGGNFKKGLMPSPQGPVIHRVEKKYEIGKVTDEEQAKQRQLKGILNKLMPQNFEKLFQQVKQVNIDNVVTLSGVVSQIFDKALMEPTFCEMYANFCFHLSADLPDLSIDNEKITFKRLLLNKCQEEFERGEREEEEANKAEAEGENEQTAEEREEKRLQVQRRMLGNIRLIGELYKKRMLAERIMHECINKLLGQHENPDEENIEALCKLMSTIGEMIDHPRAKEHVDYCFKVMLQLSNNMKLSSRVRFTLKDAIDLRRNKWQQRRKVEGPKNYVGVTFKNGLMHKKRFDANSGGKLHRGGNFQKGLMPSPQGPVIHRAEKTYEIGKVADEEQAKQRQLKGILNKLMPQNFQKLFQQVKQVNIDNVVTLSGVVSQIFDKALMEPTLCEMYANFCFHLSVDLPDFSVYNEKFTFKRLLLNKCQEEFERGEREEEEANKAEAEGENNQTAEEREEKRLQVRRRMFGNIRLIGELYKKRMLTERVMHECINMLLGKHKNPDEENIEALCKLMSTIGEMIDHPRAKEHMDYYFDVMLQLSNNMKLSSRVRFMLRDAIDLRRNKWQQRRKVEGPKKIEEVHRDAAQERHAQSTRLARGPSFGGSARRAPPMDFGPRTPNVLPSPTSHMGGFRPVSPHMRGYNNSQDARIEERHSFENRTMSVPLTQRPIGDDSITLGPQGGLARGMAFRGQTSMHNVPMGHGPNGFSSVPERAAYGQIENIGPRYGPPIYEQSHPLEQYGNRAARSTDHGFDRSMLTSPPGRGGPPTSVPLASSEKVLSEEHLRDKSMAAIKEFYSARDEKEVALCIKDLNTPSFYPSMISIWVTDSFERKDVDRDVLTKLLINLTKPGDAMIISADQLIKGFESVLTVLEDAENDAPRASEFLGRIFAKVIMENIIPLSEIGRLIYEGGEEQGQLVETGVAAKVLGSVLEIIKSEKGDSVLNEIRSSSNLQLGKFRPPGFNRPLVIDKFI